MLSRPTLINLIFVADFSNNFKNDNYVPNLLNYLTIVQYEDTYLGT